MAHLRVVEGDTVMLTDEDVPAASRDLGAPFEIAGPPGTVLLTDEAAPADGDAGSPFELARPEERGELGSGALAGTPWSRERLAPLPPPREEGTVDLATRLTQPQVSSATGSSAPAACRGRSETEVLVLEMRETEARRFREEQAEAEAAQARRAAEEVARRRREADELRAQMYGPFQRKR